ncbi:MAG: hypothetical protein J7518_17880 [Nocardioidaceae bacterium]|nr:hypothetical protein [Nocardioidaceae bacterium]
MKRLLILGGFAAGYVLGARAGRERYEQIRRLFIRVKDDPHVQQAAHHAADTARVQARHVAEKAAEKAKEHLPGMNGQEPFPTTTRF